MVRAAKMEDLKQLANLAILLWPNHSAGDLEREFSEILAKGESRFF